MLSVENLVCGYRPGLPVAGPLSFHVRAGEVVCILGPNGAGKTTLLKTILGLLQPLDGRVLLRGRDVRAFSVKEFARQAAYVPQGHIPPFPYTARDVVVMGRNPHMHEFSSPRPEDLQAAERMLERVGAAHLAGRDYTLLSGGERQLVIIARALAQDAELLVLDEPTAHLDYGNETRVLEQIRALAGAGYTVLMITHVPDHAFLYANKAVVMGRDGFFATGRPDEVLTEAALSRLYGTGIQLAETVLRESGRRVKVCVPTGLPYPAKDAPEEENL